MKQQKELLIGFVAVLVILGGLVAISKISSAPKALKASASGAGGALTAKESSFDFGEISMARGKVSHGFKVKNNSSAEALISKIYTSCMCTTANFIKEGRMMGPFGMPGHGPVPYINQSLRPGETAEVEVIFDPAAHGPAGVGPIERAVYLESGAGTIPPLQLEIKAKVTP